MKRIHKYVVEVLDYKNKNRGECFIVGKEWFTDKNANLHGLFISGILSGIDITYNDVRDMIQTCRENGNVIYDVDNTTSVMVRHYSYKVK